ncbi:PEP-CTERM sorting domain-containing protein [Oceaniferula marina]|uniref:PEP-CTERM sorting domain-containing protein n=1 Tax=Oceaniferula marina TaxID=2748318 RepID=UPI001D04C09D|nr:PEP-CTERM sorting domain-containing protein [Oceaniferula marina]
MKLTYTIAAIAATTLAANAALVDTSWNGLSGGDGAGVQQDFHGAITGFSDVNRAETTRSSDSGVQIAQWENPGVTSTNMADIAMEGGGFLTDLNLQIGDYILQDGSGGNIHAPQQTLNVDSLIGTGTVGFSYTVDVRFGTTTYAADSLINFDLWVDGASVNLQQIAATDGSTLVSFDVTGLDATSAHTAELRMKIHTTGAFNNEEEWFTAQGNLAVTAVPEPSSAALVGLGGLALILRRRK